MVFKRKLDHEKEREVALCYLCGVDRKNIKEKYDVTAQTIDRSILDKRSLNWNDSLIEFYRKRPLFKRIKLKNSAHLYLAFNGRNVERYELVSPWREKDVYNLIRSTVYFPRIEKINENLYLETFLKPTNNLERLLCEINRDGRDIIESVLMNVLQEEYNKDRFSLEAAFSNIENTLIDKIKKGGLGITDKKAELIYEELKKLSEMEQNIIFSRFGIFGSKKKILDELGDKYDRSGERIRQIKSCLITKKLRKNPMLRYLSGLVSDDDIKDYINERKEYEERNKLYSIVENAVYDIFKKKDLINDIKEEWVKKNLDKSTAELELSVRAANCLRNAGIRNVRELVQKTEFEMRKTKNFGRKSLNEIKELLSKMGLSLEMKISSD